MTLFRNTTIICFLSLLLIACNSRAEDSDQASSNQNSADPRTTLSAESTLPPPPTLTPAPTVDPAVLHLAGTYRFHPEEDESTADYMLVLYEDGTALLEEQPIGSDMLVVDASGHWYPAADGESIIFDIDTIREQPAQQDELIHITFYDGIPAVTNVLVNEQFVHLENGIFTLGAGDTGELVAALDQRLAAIDYLGFDAAVDNQFDEETRQAVVAFQASQGLVPNGVVDAETWILLDNPQPPVATPTPAPTPGIVVDVPDLSALPTHNENGNPIVYLTFDDGPFPENTGELLDVLDQYGAKATFFNIGKNVVTWPDLVRRAVSGGHYVADHTWDHMELQGMDAAQFQQEVGRTRDAILDAAGDLMTLDRNVRYIRPPYGSTDANSQQFANEQGFAFVLWDIDPQDWRRPGADVIVNHVLEHVYPGAIVLSHDGGGDRSQTIEAYRTILPTLQEQGYVFNTIYLP